MREPSAEREPSEVQDLVRVLRRTDFRERVESFAGGGSLAQGVLSARSQAYDHCFNYFRDNMGRLAQDMEKSCAVLGFYLASWGMYRGSSYLFKSTNSTQFVELVKYIDEQGSDLSRIDMHLYGDGENIERIIDSYKKVGEFVLGGTDSVRATLATKIMIAVFGCVPAFDTYFSAGMQSVQQGLNRGRRVAFGGLDRRRLDRLAAFYEANQQAIDPLHFESRTVRFPDGGPTSHSLTRAKIVDMYVFDLGMNPRR